MSYLIKLLLHKRRHRGEEESGIELVISPAAVKVVIIVASLAFVFLGADVHEVLDWLGRLLR